MGTHLEADRDGGFLMGVPYWIWIIVGIILLIVLIRMV
jgi:hypothetical protein